MGYINTTLAYLPEVYKPYFLQIFQLGESILWPFLVYFTAFPFLMRYIVIPAFNRAVDGYKHTKKWEEKKFSTHVTATLYEKFKIYL